MPMAVLVAPGMAWGRRPSDLITFTTAAISASVALAFITTSMGELFPTRLRCLQANRARSCPPVDLLAAAWAHPNSSFGIPSLKQLDQRISLRIAPESGKMINCGKLHWLRGGTA